MAILVFQHCDSETPGRLGAVLRDHAFDLDIRRPDAGGEVPSDVDDIDGVIALGGPQRLADAREPWIAREIEFLKEAHARQLPVVGICLGQQMIALALGGAVGPMDGPEVGFADVDLTAAGQTDPILAGVAWRSPQFHLHHDEVKGAPPGAVVLASSARCPVQAFRAGLRTYAFQYHPEFDRAMIHAALAASRDMLVRAGTNAAQVEAQAERHAEAFERLGRRVCENIAAYLIPGAAAAAR
jgi:GMP synthase-like glutamine amidotransferase